MENLKTYLEKKDFSTGLPQGDTRILFNGTQVEELEATFDGEKRVRGKIKTENGDEFFVPMSVLRDLKKCNESGFNAARVTRSGEGIKTRYTVVGLDE